MSPIRRYSAYRDVKGAPPPREMRSSDGIPSAEQMQRALRDRGSCRGMPPYVRCRCIHQCETGSRWSGEIRGFGDVVRTDHAENESRGLLRNISILVEETWVEICLHALPALVEIPAPAMITMFLQCMNTSMS